MTPLLRLADGFPGLVLDFLLRSSVLGLFCASALWVFRIRNTAWRYATWRFALFAMLTLPMAGIVAPAIRVPAPLVTQFVSRAEEILPDRPRYPNREDTQQVPQAKNQTRLTAPSRVSGPGISWALVGLAFYSLITAGMICRIFAGWLLMRRTVPHLERLEEPLLLERANHQCSRLGLLNFPEFRAGPAVAVPVTFGWNNPLILLPGDWLEWPVEKLDLVLAHELSHVQRGDYLIRIVSALNKSLYWFHPLSWLLHRRLAELGELLSDDAVLLASPASREQYADILSGFMNSLDHMVYRFRVGIAMSVSRRGDYRIRRVLDHNRQLYASLGFRQRLPLFCLGIPIVILLAGAKTMTLSGMPLKPRAPTAVVNAQDVPSSTQPPPRLPRSRQDHHPIFSPLVLEFRDTRDIPKKEQLLNQMALGAFEEFGRQLLLLAKTTKDNDTRWLAIRGLGMLKFEPAAPFLVESLQSPERYVRANSARALGEIGYSAAAPALMRLLTVEQDGGVIEQTSLALRMTRAVGAIPTSESRMSAGASPTLQTQCWLLDAIAGLGSERELPFIAKYLYGPSPGIVGVQECAARAMATLSGEDFGFPRTTGLYDPMAPISTARRWWENRQNRERLN